MMLLNQGGINSFFFAINLAVALMMNEGGKMFRSIYRLIILVRKCLDQLVATP